MLLGGARDVGDDLTLKTRRKVWHYLMRHVYVYEFKLSIAPAPL
jgi:hypothetical protein